MKDEGEDKFKIEILWSLPIEEPIRHAERYLNNYSEFTSKDPDNWSRGTISTNYYKNVMIHIEDGTHNFIADHPSKTPEGKERCKRISYENAISLVEKGIHHFLGPKVNNIRIKNGTHHFIGNTNPSKTPEGKERIRANTRKSNARRYENGNDLFYKTQMVTALNIQTGVSSRIPLSQFYAHKDIYFSNRSKVYKDWQQSNIQNITLE